MNARISNITTIINSDRKASAIAAVGLIGSIVMVYVYHGTAMLVFFGLAYVASNLLGDIFNISTRNKLAIATAIAFTLSYATSSQALIFEGLETALTTALSGTGDAIDENVVTGFFMFVRVVVGIGFIVGIVVALTRAFQGADWAPLGQGLAIALFAVIAIEMMSFMLVGTGSGGGGGGA